MRLSEKRTCSFNTKFLEKLDAMGEETGIPIGRILQKAAVKVYPKLKFEQGESKPAIKKKVINGKKVKLKK